MKGYDYFYSAIFQNPSGVFHNRIRMVHNPLVIRDFPNISVKPLHVKMIKKDVLLAGLLIAEVSHAA